MHNCIARIRWEPVQGSAKAAPFMDFSLCNIQAWNVLILRKLAEPGVQKATRWPTNKYVEAGSPVIHPMTIEMS